MVRRQIEGAMVKGVLWIWEEENRKWVRPLLTGGRGEMASGPEEPAGREQ